MQYRADIDGIRTIAVLLVLVFHFDLLAFGKAGFIGVDVFFVISGFLITAIIRKDLENQTFHFGTFLYRRIRRLYPALLATLIVTLVAGWFLFLPFRFAELATETFWSMLNVVNFYFWQNINYFKLRAGNVPLLHMWSLSVEEQFYFFFPLACYVFWRWARKLLLPAAILVALISFGLGLVFTPIKPELSFYLLPTRAWELLMGSVLALMVHGRDMRGGWLYWMGPLGLVLIVASVVLHGPLTLVPGWFLLLPTFGAVALILGGYALSSPVTRLLSSPVFVWIGKISYPLYLVHWPIRIFLREHTIEFTMDWRILGFVLSFGAATAIYYLIEMPIRRGRVLAGRAAYLGTAFGLAGALIAVSVLITRDDGMPGRFAPEVIDVLAFRDDTPKPFQACDTPYKTVGEMCALGQDGGPRETMVIGDSHALTLAGALDQWLAGEGRSGAIVFHHGCMPVMGAGRDRCRSAIEDALALAQSSPNVRDVVLVSIWRQGLPGGGKPFDGRWVPEDEVAEVFAARLSQTVARLRAAGKRVILIEPLFAAPRSVPQTLAANLAFGRDWPVDIALSQHQATFAPVFAAFDQVEGEGVQRISLIDGFCAGGTCRAVVDGLPLFTDNNHLAFSQSGRMAKILAGQ